MELTDPEQFDVGSDEWVLHFDTHQINLIGLMISGDEGFEAALAHGT